MKGKIFWGLFLLFLLFFSPSGFSQGLDTIRIKNTPIQLKTEKKSPTGALFRSLIFPGWGQFYNKQYFKSVLVFSGETALLIAAAVDWSRANEHKRNFESLPETQLGEKLWEFEQYKFYRDRKNQFLWITSAVVFVSMFDAYVDAHLFDFNQEQMEDIHVKLTPRKDGLFFVLSLNL